MPRPDERRAPPIGGRYAGYVTVVLVIVYVFNFIDRQIVTILAEHIKADLGISDAQIGFLYGTAFAVFYAIFGIPLGKLADTWTRKNLIAVGIGFWSLMTALSGTARSFGSLATYRVGVGIGEASATPAAFSMLSDYFPPALRATVLASIRVGSTSARASASSSAAGSSARGRLPTRIRHRRRSDCGAGRPRTSPSVCPDS